MAKEVIHSPRLGDTPGVARVVKAGGLLFIMGQAPMDETRTNVVGKGDMKAQARRCFEKMKVALEDAGASMDNLVQLRIFLTDIGRISEVSEVRKEYLPKGGVAGTGVQVKALVDPDMLVEIDGIAVCP
jgi:enamine deaminase RidA (YjgF/YER057c/UK114 family)